LDLFSLFLSSAADEVTQCGAGGTLNVLAHCPICSQKDELGVGNIQFNDIECTNCHKHLRQYTNACDFTINKESRQIGHAVARKTKKGCEWKFGGFFDPKRMFWLPWRVRLEGLCGRKVIVNTTVTSCEENKEVSSHTSVIKVDSKRYQCVISHGHPKSRFDDTESRIFATDIKLVSENHDVIYESRRIVQLFK
jgi:Zn ribbon nucleic-acid-binding protein